MQFPSASADALAGAVIDVASAASSFFFSIETIAVLQVGSTLGQDLVDSGTVTLVECHEKP